ncbi:MAG: dockerin type I repeat-containing protein [Aeoliella sp.]
MAITISGAARRAGCCLVIALLSPAALRAHVELDSPNGGETLNVGSTFTIQWHPSVQHDTIDWDLWYSTTSSNGPWNVISLNLPLGDPAAGSNHSHNWLVPNLGNTNAWVRVRQDNGTDDDYFDVSDSSFSIVAALLAGDFNENGQVNSGDLVNWEAGYGTPSGAAHTNGDADRDGDVDGIDLLAWQQQTAGTGVVAVLQAVPEPLTWPLWLLGCFATISGRYR